MTVTTQQYISTVEELREIISAPAAGSPVLKKELPSLDHHCRSFIEKAPFALLSTAGADGRCDVSPRGDGPGFVHVLDDNTLAIPDRPGNRRLDSMENILENPHAGLLFMIPNVDETLRINGTARITVDPELLGQMAVNGKVPSLAIHIQPEEVFFHCARAFKRSQLWNPETWIDRGELPTLGQILSDQLKALQIDADEADRALEEANKQLY